MKDRRSKPRKYERRIGTRYEDMEPELPTKPLTITSSPNGLTTGNAIEDNRLARAIVWAKEQAKKFSKPLYVYEHPKHGLELSTAAPKDLPFVHVYPGGRTIFRPLRSKS